MRKRLFVLLTCLFVVMIGCGITMPVLPFYSERLASAGGVSRVRSRPANFHQMNKQKISLFALELFFGNCLPSRL